MMFQERRGWVPVAAIVAGAGCLALSACGSSSSSSAASAAGATASSAGAASSARTADPLASLSAARIEAEATANAVAAATLTINWTITQSGQVETIEDLGIKRGVGCAGTIAEGGKGSFKLILVGSTVYINPDGQFWAANAGSSASAVIALVKGRYLKTTRSDKNMAGIGDLCDVHKLLTSGGTTAETKEAVTTLGGIRVVPLEISDGSTDYVTDTSSPQFVEATSPKGSANGSGKITIMVNTPVTVAAPPASQVIDGSRLGF
jgi:hypothetical protein